MNIFKNIINRINRKEELTIKFLVEECLTDVTDLKYLSTFKFKKSIKSYTRKTDFGFYKIEIEIFKTVDSERNELAVCLRPIFCIRFNELSEWFEKYSFKTISDQRNNGQVYFEGFTKKEYLLLESGKNFKSDYKLFKDSLEKDAELIFSKYKTLNDYYNLEVIPILENKKEMNDNGADWIFEMLYATKVVEPNRYSELKEKIKKRIEYMVKINEPNISQYVAKFDEIYRDIEKSKSTIA